MTYSGYVKDHPAYCLDHQCRKFHVLKYIMIERKFQALSWQRKKSFLTNDRKKKPYPSDQVKRQIKYQCWHVNKHTRPWGGLFIFPWGIYEAAAFLIPVSSASHIRRELLYNYLWPRLLHPNSADNSGAQRDRELGPQISPPT